MSSKRWRIESASDDEEEKRVATAARLPLELIQRIAMHLADYGCRSAATAALIHPSFTKEALLIQATRKTIVFVRDPSSLQSWIRWFQPEKKQDGFSAIDILRLRPSLSSSVPYEDQLYEYLKHFFGDSSNMKTEYGRINVVQISSPVAWDGKTGVNQKWSRHVRQLTLFQGSYSRSTFNLGTKLESLTLVEPLPDLFQQFQVMPLLKTVYLIFLDDGEKKMLPASDTMKKYKFREDALDIIHERANMNSFIWVEGKDYFLRSLVVKSYIEKVYLIALSRDKYLGEEEAKILAHETVEIGEIEGIPREITLVSYHDVEWNDE